MRCVGSVAKLVVAVRIRPQTQGPPIFAVRFILSTAWVVKLRKNAKSDNERLRKHTDSLKITINSTQKLLQGPDTARLKTSQKLHQAIGDTYLGA